MTEHRVVVARDRRTYQRVACVDPAPVDVQRPRSVLQDVPRYGPDERFAGEYDRFICGLERGAISPPALGARSSGGGDVSDAVDGEGAATLIEVAVAVSLSSFAPVVV